MPFSLGAKAEWWKVGFPKNPSTHVVLSAELSHYVAGGAAVQGRISPKCPLFHGCCWEAFSSFASCGLAVELQPLSCHGLPGARISIGPRKGPTAGCVAQAPKLAEWIGFQKTQKHYWAVPFIACHASPEFANPSVVLCCLYFLSWGAGFVACLFACLLVCLFVCLLACLFVCLFVMYVCMFVCLFVCLFCFVCLFACLCVCVFLCLFVCVLVSIVVCLAVCLAAFCLCAYLFIYLLAGLLGLLRV